MTEVGLGEHEHHRHPHQHLARLDRLGGNHTGDAGASSADLIPAVAEGGEPYTMGLPPVEFKPGPEAIVPSFCIGVEGHRLPTLQYMSDETNVSQGRIDTLRPTTQRSAHTTHFTSMLSLNTSCSCSFSNGRAGISPRGAPRRLALGVTSSPSFGRWTEGGVL